MSDSLQDQLLALGLAKEKPRKSRSKPGSRRKGGGRGAGKSGKAGKGGEISLDAAYRARAREEKSKVEQAKAEKRAQDLERRRINGEVQKLLDGHALNDREGELKRNFLYKGKIRSVRVNADQLRALNAGDLALVFLRGDYLVVKPEVADQVRTLSPDHVPDLGSEDPGEEEFPVPDDIVW
ncbi:MAG: DUF2058 family protein [Xanthomonadales bacterium]|jgi:uncharacterized protein YaiL (DUF2058 family)|nr:DUF2058 family protein [Xanthomonadales bacterium]